MDGSEWECVHCLIMPQINHSENITNIIENPKNHESIQRIKLAFFVVSL